MNNEPTEWTKELDKEFRLLALEEAKGTITLEQLARLEQLEDWRNKLESPPTETEIQLIANYNERLEKLEEQLAKLEATIVMQLGVSYENSMEAKSDHGGKAPLPDQDSMGKGCSSGSE